MLYGLVIALHVIVCIVLILTILLQAGRGGGLNETFGGNLTQSMFGTKANVFLTRATTASAIIFICTCILLGIMTSRRGRSLIDLQGYINKQQAAQGAHGMPGHVHTEGEDLPVTLDQAKKDLPKAGPQNVVPVNAPSVPAAPEPVQVNVPAAPAKAAVTEAKTDAKKAEPATVAK